MSRDFKLSLAVLLPIAVAGMLWLPHSPGGRQRANMALVEAHLPRLREAIGDDPRFQHVEFGVSTGGDGQTDVYGYVKSDTDLSELKRRIETTAPPRPVHWLVEVFPDE